MDFPVSLGNCRGGVALSRNLTRIDFGYGQHKIGLLNESYLRMHQVGGWYETTASINEDTSKRRTNHVRERKSCIEYTEQQRALLEWSDSRDDNKNGDQNPTCANASDGTTEDEDVDALSNSAEQRVDFEDEDGAEMDPFVGIVARSCPIVNEKPACVQVTVSTQLSGF